MALSSSLDQIGPFAKSVDDARILFNALRGHDERDSTSLPDGYARERAGKPKVLGVPRAFLEKGCDPDVLAHFESTLDSLRTAGYEIRDIEMPNLPYSLAVYYIIQPAEASTNLARYDGIRYGLSMPAESIGEVYAKTRGAGFGREVRRRILIGTFVLSSGYADAYYRKARDVRASIRKEFETVFASGIDAVVTPTTPSPAFKFGEKSDPVAMYAEDVFAVPVNLAGVPGMSVPCGNVIRDGVSLPVGFQIIAAHGNDDALFDVGTDVEMHGTRSS
jgi:aspartyl-tRNA(Asn)/glutamyl-tRNA(Gln) amidotransferase subunit A